MCNVDQNQGATDAGDGAAGIEPVGRGHRVSILQLIRLPGNGGDREGDNRAIENIEELDFRDLVGRRAEGNSQFEYGAVVTRPTLSGRPIEITIAA